jgi:hypothetical protein
MAGTPHTCSPGQADELRGDALQLASRLTAVGLGVWTPALEDIADELSRIAGGRTADDGDDDT